MDHLSKRIADLSGEKLALLLKRIKKEPETPPQERPIPRRAVHNDIPLSFAQTRLWFIDQLEPGSSAYNIPTAVRFSGRIDLAALRRSFQEIIRRHESLRTTFATNDGEPSQVIEPESNFVLPVVDLRGAPEPEREAEARRLANEEVETPFDLAGGPLLRARLLLLEEAAGVLLLTMHHIVSDGWSVGVFYHELRLLYQAYSTGAAPALPEPVIQYADYSAWQRGWLQGELLEAQLSYWKRRLAGAPEALEMRTDHPRPPVQSSRGSFKVFALSRSLSGALRELSRIEKTTLFMTLLAAFQTLLRHYTNSEDLPVATNVSNRSRPETQGVIGFFVNQLVMRASFKGDPTFRELLARVREVTLEAYAHQDVPFEKVVMALRPERNLDRQPLSQFKFDLQNARVSVLELPGLQLSPFDIDLKMTHFDLTLSMTDTDEMLTGFFQYSADLFEAATVERMLGHYMALLRAVVARPDVRVSRLCEMLAEAEAQETMLMERQLKEVRRRTLRHAKRKALGA
jgi:hypothetical protein